MASRKLLVYLMRRDLRVCDNPILHHLGTAKEHGFTHLLPVYVFPAHQVEVSGFIDDPDLKSPYPEARSRIGKFWRCGPHRAKFLAQCVWDVKESLESMNSGLEIRVGKQSDYIKDLIENLKDATLCAVWMTKEDSSEEVVEQNQIASVCKANGVDFKLWVDEKYFIDDRDTGLKKPTDLPDVFTEYRKAQEPLRERPRRSLPHPDTGTLPAFPDSSSIPKQFGPFVGVRNYDDLEARLLNPLQNILSDPPAKPQDAVNSHPLLGGESPAWERLMYLIHSGNILTYKDTRNGLSGVDFSTKLSAYLALGCITARQIHFEMLGFEDGTNDEYAEAPGYGQGEGEGTASMRFELVWRDYMHLCAAKFLANLFKLEGFRYDAAYKKTWLAPADGFGDYIEPSEAIGDMLKRFLEGSTGMGFIDASMRELYHTGYTSNRARQNVASFLTKHLNIDWRYGAEWYECMLIDYDCGSNWSNWQYVAGVGNDPRGDARVFNPVKQAFDYDRDGSFTKMWVPEVRHFSKLENIFQLWTAKKSELALAGLTHNIMVTDPVKAIEFTLDRRPNRSGKMAHPSRGKGRGRGRGGGKGGGASRPPPSDRSPGSSSGDKGSGGNTTIPSNRGGGRGGRGGGRGSRGRGSNNRNRPGPSLPRSAFDGSSSEGRSGSDSKTDGGGSSSGSGSSGSSQRTIKPYRPSRLATSTAASTASSSTTEYSGPLVVNGSNAMYQPGASGSGHRASPPEPNRAATQNTSPAQSPTQTRPQAQRQNHTQTRALRSVGGQNLYLSPINSPPQAPVPVGALPYGSPPNNDPFAPQPMNNLNNGQPMGAQFMGSPPLDNQYINHGYNNPYAQPQAHPMPQPAWAGYAGHWQQPQPAGYPPQQQYAHQQMPQQFMQYQHPPQHNMQPQIMGFPPQLYTPQQHPPPPYVPPQQHAPQQNVPQQNIAQQIIPQQNIPQQNMPQQNAGQPNMGQQPQRQQNNAHNNMQHPPAPGHNFQHGQ